MADDARGVGRRATDSEMHLNALTRELARIEKANDLLSSIQNTILAENAALRRQVRELERELAQFRALQEN